MHAIRYGEKIQNIVHFLLFSLLLTYRDNIFPVELVLENAVSLLTESYREPFRLLLTKAANYLTNDIKIMLEDTLKPYPHFKVMLMNITCFLCVSNHVNKS